MRENKIEIENIFISFAINVNFPEGENERGSVATPTSFSLFESNDIKSLWFKFGHDIFTGSKIASLYSWNDHFSAVLWNEIKDH